MGLFNWFNRKPKQNNQVLKPLKIERRGLGWRLAKASQKTYIVKVAMLYEGKGHRQFDVKIKAASRDRAATMAKEKLSLQVLSAYQEKIKK